MASPFSSNGRGTTAHARLDDAFGLLGLEARFDVDPARLESAFFEASKELHADRFATAPAPERVAALSRSRALNDAYQLLKREASRAEYLLAREGLKIGDNERIDPALVMELLEEREELAEARTKGDRPAIEKLCSSMKHRRREALDCVKTLFRAVEGPGERVAFPEGNKLAGDARAAQLAAIKGQLILLRYVERYLEECDAALDELDEE